MKVKFEYNGKIREGEVISKFRSKKNVHCITVQLINGETKTFHEDKIKKMQYMS